MAPWQGNAVVEPVGFENPGLIGGDVLIRERVIPAPHIGVAEGADEAVITRGQITAVVVGGDKFERTRFGVWAFFCFDVFSIPPFIFLEKISSYISLPTCMIANYNTIAIIADAKICCYKGITRTR